METLLNINNAAAAAQAQTVAVARTAPLPETGALQAGFADILGGSDAVQTKTNKSGAVRYCLLPVNGKGKSLKSVTGLKGAALRNRHARELAAFSAKAGVAFNSLLASGEYKVAAVTEGKTGAATFKLIPVVASFVAEPTKADALSILAKEMGMKVEDVCAALEMAKAPAAQA